MTDTWMKCGTEIIETHVADLGCLSRSRFLSIPDPGSRIQQQQQKSKKKISCPTFFVATNVTNIENYFIFEQVQTKKNLANLPCQCQKDVKSVTQYETEMSVGGSIQEYCTYAEREENWQGQFHI